MNWTNSTVANNYLHAYGLAMMLCLTGVESMAAYEGFLQNKLAITLAVKTKKMEAHLTSLSHSNPAESKTECSRSLY